MRTLAALNEGGRQLSRFRKLVVLFYLVNLIAALVVAAPVMALIGASLGHSLESDREFLNLDPSWMVETLSHYHYWPVSTAGLTFATVGLLYLILNTFLAGGALAVFYRENDAFMSASARYFWRFLRLLALSLVVYALVMALNGALTAAIARARETSMEAGPWIMLGWLRMLVLWILLGVVNMIFDYAKIILVTGDRRSAWRASLAAFRFVWRRMGRTLAVYWICAGIGLLFFLAYHGITEAVGQASPFAVLLVLVIRQLYMLSRMWTRLWTWSSEMHVYAGESRPVQTFNSTMVAPEPPSLAVAG